MKITALIIALSLATPSHAGSDAECSGFAEFAEIIMTARQNGTSLQDALDAADDFHPNARIFVILAWQQPRYNTLGYQQRAIGDWRDRSHLECLMEPK